MASLKACAVLSSCFTKRPISTVRFSPLSGFGVKECTEVKDAEANAESDKERRELAEAKNQAEAMIHKAESDLVEHADAIEEDDKTAVEEALAECKEVAEGEDTALIVDKVQVLSAALMKVGQAMYEKASADQDTGPASQADQAEDDDDVVDAEFEDVDEEDVA